MKAFPGIAVVIAAAVFCHSPAARAACHFDFEHPVVCWKPLPAAIAWTKLGTDSSEIMKSYNQQILHEANCGTPYKGDQIRSAVIELRGHGKIATGSGWVPVSMIEVNHHVSEIYYVADAYLAGVCDKYEPGTDTDTD